MGVFGSVAGGSFIPLTAGVRLVLSHKRLRSAVSGPRGKVSVLRPTESGMDEGRGVGDSNRNVVHGRWRRRLA